MRRMLTVGLAVASLLTWSCGESQAPTSPSTLPVPSVTVTGPGSTTNLTVTWSCLTQSTAHMTGILSSAAECPARLGQLTPSPAAVTAPDAPGNVMSSVNGSTVSVGWTGPTSGDQATSYVIEAGSSPGASNLVVFDTGTAGQAFTATSVPAGTYYVRVRAKNAAGTSGPSNEVTIIVSGGGPGPCTGGAPGAPTNLTVSITGSTVTFTWNAPAGGCAPTTYGVEAGSSPGASNLANILTGNASTSFVASNVPAGTYYVRVRAGNGSVVGGVSNEVTVVRTNFEGTWSGTTTQQGNPAALPIMFTVNSANAVTFLRVGWQMVGPCLQAIYVFLVPDNPPLAITNSSFTFSKMYRSSPPFTAVVVSGTFGSGSTASGTATIQDWTGFPQEPAGCSGTVNLVWTATKQ